ncbi:MAG: hypothetical protein WD042_03455 [Phycisphaeraceae bacterium]
MNTDALRWWSNLLHGGMLLDWQRLSQVMAPTVAPLPFFQVDRLRRELAAFGSEPGKGRSTLVAFMLEKVCRFETPQGAWHRGSKIDSSWTRRGFGNEAIRPAHLWIGPHDSLLPVFLDDNKRLGLGRGKRTHSQALLWLRATSQSLALLTNGQQWRLIFAGLDFDAFVEWDISQWFTEGEPSEEFAGFRSLLQPRLWHSEQPGAACPLLAAVRDSRKGQADLSQVLGERVRQAAEHLIQAHAAALTSEQNLPPADIYRAAVRMIMRLVVVLFAESRERLLPRDNTIYYNTYSLHGLRELLDRISPHRLADAWAAYPRILALFKLIYAGSTHEAMPVPAYGGELFAPGRADSADGMSRAMRLFEAACLNQSLMSDLDVRKTLDLLTRTKIKIRQGRTATWVTAPVDFSSLDSAYIGILYEGLLDFELRCAAPDEPIVFLAVGNEPALPLSTLEQMDDSAVKNLLAKLKDTSSSDDEEAGDDEAGEAEAADEEAESEETAEEAQDQSSDEAAAEPPPETDPHYTLQARAENWARRVCQLANLVTKTRGKATPEKQMQYDRALAAKARQLVVKVVLPGEWFLVRWGGTRKGSGTFYTRPPLAVPTVHRTLRPLAYDPPLGADGKPDTLAPTTDWSVKPPEAILAIKVCDPACGSGSFPLAALRFLTNALFESMQKYGRFRQHNGRDIMDLIRDQQGKESLVNEALPCRPDDDDFEPRVKAVLRRYIVERCIYGVDLNPLSVELCRLALWIETLDPSLPMTFLDHKIKPGNALVGAWFDQFLHYPAMAWEREGGDKTHTNGVHFQKEAWTKAIKALAKQVKDDLKHFIDGGHLFYPIDLTTVQTGHDAAEAALKAIHELGITQVDQRAQQYEALLASPAFQRLKAAFDLWCALWFWPADQLDDAPLPTEFAESKLNDVAIQTASRLAGEHRFFHWELEFPDVFNAGSQGFSAVLGNPPWETLQPNSKEFFSALDPLYRSYGKQEALGKQREYFQNTPEVERQWLEYNAHFKCLSGWLNFAAFPFGHRQDRDGQNVYHLNLGDRGRDGVRSSERRHERWKAKREETSGYADTEHAFRHQGSGKAYTYKMFTEQAHTLLAEGGRLGFIVPSGLYSDFGSVDLRKLFLDACSWEWLFGFENREAIFDIHRSFKFNPVIVAKGGQTQAIRTAFMRRNLADWEHAEQFATDYTRQQVVQFSPKSRAILEIQSQRDLEVLTKIYANSVLLGDQSDRGWGIRYAQGDFNMTSDSKLFPPRPKWEEWGYQPDEYSRWIKGDWRPIEELWRELGVDASNPTPINPACAMRIEEGIAAGEVAPPPLPLGEGRGEGGQDIEGDNSTPRRLRIAQPPYDTLPISRADLPPGVILSRDASHFIRETDIPVVTFTDAGGKPLKIKVENEDGDKEEIEVTGPAVALPLYQGVAIWQMESCASDYLKGATHSARWERRRIYAPRLPESQFAIGASVANAVNPSSLKIRIGFRAIQNATNQRTMIASLLPATPAGNSLGVIRGFDLLTLALPPFMCDFAYDFSLRPRMSQANLNWFILEETPVPCQTLVRQFPQVLSTCLRLTMTNTAFSPAWTLNESLRDKMWKAAWATRDHERVRLRASSDAIALAIRMLKPDDLAIMVKDCDHSLKQIQDSRFASLLYVKDFWRVDKDKPPEHRHTILSLIAFHDLQLKIATCGGDVAAGIEAFCNQNDGEGWMLPETLRLADYGLGHDDRAQEHQPVRACFGPRFYDWQLAQTPEESWRECHLHARNLLGAEGYQKLLDEIERGDAADAPAPTKIADAPDASAGKLFDTTDAPLFQSGPENPS